MLKSKKIMASAAVLSVLATPVFAGNSNNSSVVDQYGSPVRSLLGNKCVVTKWEGLNDKCVCSKAKPAAKQAPAMSAKPEKVQHEYNRSYMIFFDFDNYKVGGEAQSVLGNILEHNAKANNVRFNITGHADRSGSRAYNKKLSQLRAASVKKGLVALGVAENAVKINWKGEDSPLVNTKDSTKEPQNRRVEVSISAVK